MNGCVAFFSPSHRSLPLFSAQSISDDEWKASGLPAEHESVEWCRSGIGALNKITYHETRVLKDLGELHLFYSLYCFFFFQMI